MRVHTDAGYPSAVSEVLVTDASTVGPSGDECAVSTGIDKSARFLIWSIAAVLIMLPVLIQQRIGKDSRSVDFVYFYAASKIIHDSPAENIYNPEIQNAASQKVLPILDGKFSYGYFPYPPFVALLFAQAAHLPFWTAFRIHQAISFALYALGLVILLRRFFPGQPILSSMFLPFALAYLPWVSNTWLNGQLSALGFIAFAWALAEQKSGHLFRSGLALSLCLYKPTLLVLLIPMLLFRRQLRVLLGFAAGACVLVGAATIAFGWHIWAAYARLVLSLGYIERLRELHQYVDLVAFFSQLAGNRFAGLLALLCAAAALPFLIAACRRYNRNSPLAWASTISWTLILSPYVPLYDTILIIPSMIASADTLRLRGKSALPGVLLLMFVCSWLSAALALVIHVQLLTLAIALLGSLQAAVLLRKTGSPKAL